MHTKGIRVFVILLLVFLTAVSGIRFYARRSLPGVEGNLELSGICEQVRIVRDSRGIPHIFASNDQDAFFGLGFVHAQDRLWQMEIHRRIGAGRLSEIFGEKTLKTDQFLRTLGVYRASRKAWDSLGDNVQNMFRSYVKGVNEWIEQD